MLKRKFKHFTLSLIMTAFTSAYADVDLHAGMWEITSKIEMSGIPVKIPKMKVSQCINKENIIPKTNQKVNEHCSIAEQKIEGNTVTWKINCGGKVESQGSVTYHGDTFNGLINTQSEVPSMGMMTMTIQLTGKRTGECN